ncbi:unnamed protein product [Symbiodinium natans]|uniref:Uncharacterized protein n=1 Tax=Symbiodinium natans TaxID=878477 RepID=A0A812UGG6_9DINO|nr:unnamed protein product [Symbiodinium natans]
MQTSQTSSNKYFSPGVLPEGLNRVGMPSILMWLGKERRAEVFADFLNRVPKLAKTEAESTVLGRGFHTVHVYTYHSSDSHLLELIVCVIVFPLSITACVVLWECKKKRDEAKVQKIFAELYEFHLAQERAAERGEAVSQAPEPNAESGSDVVHSVHSVHELCQKSKSSPLLHCEADSCSETESAESSSSDEGGPLNSHQAKA